MIDIRNWFGVILFLDHYKNIKNLKYYKKVFDFWKFKKKWKASTKFLNFKNNKKNFVTIENIET